MPSKPKGAKRQLPGVHLAGRVAVVTGASRGIGLALAHALADAGCDLALTARNVTAPQQSFPRALVQACDVRDERSVATFFTAAARRFRKIDFLINNAGIAHAMQPVGTLDVATWNNVIATNLTGMFLCTRAALPLLHRGGVIVNNLSIAATTAFPGLAAYDASKHGALGFTNTLREELRERGIRVLALIEGATDTDIWQQFMPEADRKTMMRPEDVAAAVLHAISLPPEAPIEEIRMLPLSGTSRT